MFSRYGIPEVMMSDNGPQYSSQEMKDFASSYGFIQVTSSPHYPQSNGLAERMVRTMKELLKKSEDPYLALLNYRTTPFPWCNLSPAELMMGRQIQNNMPQVDKHLVPKWSYLSDFKEKMLSSRRNKRRITIGVIGLDHLDQFQITQRCG